VTWLGIVLLVPLVWIVLTAFDAQRAAFGVTAAARAAGRAYALAPDDATGRARATEAARAALDDQGLGTAPLTVRVGCGGSRDCHAADEVVTVSVASRVALPLLPSFFGGGHAHGLDVDATETVPIGHFQDGP
jgi:hypothetical protein